MSNHPLLLRASLPLALTTLAPIAIATLVVLGAGTVKSWDMSMVTVPNPSSLAYSSTRITRMHGGWRRHDTRRMPPPHLPSPPIVKTLTAIAAVIMVLATMTVAFAQPVG